MTTSFNDSLSRLRSRTIDLLWSQWSFLGVAGDLRPGDNRIIDPEALVLVTTRFGRHDSRLLDESIDWLSRFGRRINLQRLQGLQRQWPGVVDARVLAAMAGVLDRQVAHRKWRVLLDRAPTPDEAEPLFFRSDGSPAATSGEAEPAFERHGLLRGDLELRGMSRPPDARLRENLLLTLRSLLGVNARAEIMAWLLTHDSGHPAAIARSTGYFSKSIQQILNEMEESGQIHSVRHGREKHFRIRPENWQFLLPPPAEGQSAFPRWVEWMPRFAAITRFMETLAMPGIDGKSESFRAIQLREALEAATPSLVRAGIIGSFRATPALRGEELLHTLLNDLEILVR